jgi:hypothetical protein
MATQKIAIAIFDQISRRTSPGTQDSIANCEPTTRIGGVRIRARNASSHFEADFTMISNVK